MATGSHGGRARGGVKCGGRARALFVFVCAYIPETLRGFSLTFPLTKVAVVEQMKRSFLFFFLRFLRVALRC